MQPPKFNYQSNLNWNDVTLYNIAETSEIDNLLRQVAKSECAVGGNDRHECGQCPSNSGHCSMERDRWDSGIGWPRHGRPFSKHTASYRSVHWLSTLHDFLDPVQTKIGRSSLSPQNGDIFDQPNGPIRKKSIRWANGNQTI